MIPTYLLLLGDAVAQLRQLPSESVHCVVTSPPYWSLRDYRAKGQIGLEADPAAYVAKLLEVFAEVRRVLRSDGTCWVNLGDCYAQSGRGKVGSRSTLNGSRYCHNEANRAMKARGESYRRPPAGWKPKDLLLLPARVAIALQDAGWWLRADLIWEKPNAIPEPVRDRPTRAHEYLFLLSKSEHYFYDDVAVQERALGGGGRNLRSVWRIPTIPYPEAHFATFPEELVEPCVRAGTSERGCCSSCGTPVLRRVKRVRTVDGVPAPKLGAFRSTSKGAPSYGNGIGHGRIATQVQTTGWEPGCRCSGGGGSTCRRAGPVLRLRHDRRGGAEARALVRRRRAQSRLPGDERAEAGRGCAAPVPPGGGGRLR